MVFDKDYMQGRLSERIKEIWESRSETLPDFLQQYSEREKEENELRISQNIEAFKKQLNRFPHSAILPFRKKRWKREMEKLFKGALFEEPLLGLKGIIGKEAFKGFEQQAKVFLRRAREFDKALSMEDMGQALRNYLVYAIFLELNGLEQNCSPAIFGYSMLYPYTDNYIDSPHRTGEEKKRYNQLIMDKIKGVSYEAASVHEERTVRLLDAIEDSYERPDEIYAGLLFMLEAQKNSQRQSEKGAGLREEDILAISIYKGGLSVLIDRYFINKPFLEGDIEFYYGFGFLLQLCDDLQDISQDKEDGSRTLFSVCEATHETEGKINKLLHYTDYIFSSYQSEQEEFKQFLLHNSYQLILFSALFSREHISGQYLLELGRRIPVSAEFLYNLKTELAFSEQGKENSVYMHMLDELMRE